MWGLFWGSRKLMMVSQQGKKKIIGYGRDWGGEIFKEGVKFSLKSTGVLNQDGCNAKEKILQRKDQ